MGSSGGFMVHEGRVVVVVGGEIRSRCSDKLATGSCVKIRQ